MNYYELGYTGKMFSLNDCKSLHWRALKKKVDKLEIEFKKIIREANTPRYEKFEVEVEYYNRYDVDNIAFTIKCMIDCLVREKKLIDDDKRYWEKLTITANRKLKNNTIIFRIIEC